MKALKIALISVSLLTAYSLTSNRIVEAAGSIMPSFAAIPAGWTTDRHEPASFANVGIYQGHSDVLGIGIDSTTGQAARAVSFKSLFYSTQGRKFTFSPVEGSGAVLSSDLYIPSTWADSANGHRRTDMWGGLVNGANAVVTYPIIGFTNYGGTPRLRVWDDNTALGWVDLASPVNYDTWTAFSIELTAGSIDYYVDGSLVYSDTTLNGAVAFKEVIMQAYNFEHPDIPGAIVTPYTAYWSNTQIDSDADGLADGLDNCPFNANSGQEDWDGDGIGDACDAPSSKDQCKKGGWMNFIFPKTFKNQGDCIQFFNTGK